ncbi:MAG: radical SAM protein [Deltaproteobacteria bacterium]|nr:radical SAM protein [Deltaproteobacteria bacterium]
MKILLIYPYCLEDRLHAEDVSVVPMGVYYVAALLRENHYDVEILNWHDMNKAPHRIRETLAEKKPDVIGLSIVHANRWGGIDIARIAKQVDPGVKIVFGGVGATFLWEHLLTHFKEIDFAVIGEGEYSFLELVKCIEREERGTLGRIKGIAFRKSRGTAVKTAPADVVKDLDALPVPAKYFTYQHLSSTRGCPGKCAFCGSPRIWGPKVRFHSPENFVDQLELLYKKGITFFWFSDDTFTMKKSRVIKICKEILRRNLKISWQAISHVHYVGEEILYWMRKAGCVQISYGVESGSERIRKGVLNKDIRTDQIKRAFDLTTGYGILARAYFIYGAPGESWATIQETIDLIHEIRPLGIIFYILDIFPGTALYDDYMKKCRLTDDIWLKQIEDIMYFETDPRLTQELILAFGEKLRAEYYENLPGFVENIELMDNEDLFETHSDFLSRLGMTFSHGDYAGIDAIQDKGKIAERLFAKALEYHPDHRAYLGLGILKQKSGRYQESMATLSKGVQLFPDSVSLNICLGISHMNLGEYEKALARFLKCEHSKDALPYISNCYREMGDFEKERVFQEKLEAHRAKPFPP